MNAQPHLANPDLPPPKTPGRSRRSLALTAGGVRGIIEVAFLEAIEAAYRCRYGPETRLHDVLDFVGGTSTGALIATAINLGQPIEQIRDF